MYQWRKFEFFEDKSKPKMIPSEISSSIPSSSSSSPSPVPSEPEVSIQCCSSGRGRIIFGCADGNVGFLGRTFNLLYSFQAYTSSFLFLHQLKVKQSCGVCTQSEAKIWLESHVIALNRSLRGRSYLLEVSQYTTGKKKVRKIPRRPRPTHWWKARPRAPIWAAAQAWAAAHMGPNRVNFEGSVPNPVPSMIPTLVFSRNPCRLYI